MTLNCTATSVCDATGVCKAGGTKTVFDLSPLKTDAAGAGNYEISRDGTKFDAMGVSRTGPFTWSQGGDDAQVLLLTGAASALWQAFDRRSETSAVSFLMCEVTG